MDHLKRLTDHAIEVFLFVVIRNSGYNNVDDIYEKMTSLSCHQYSPSPTSVTNIVNESYFNFSFKTEQYEVNVISFIIVRVRQCHW